MHLESKSIYVFLEKLSKMLQILCEIETIDRCILDIFYNIVM